MDRPAGPADRWRYRAREREPAGARAIAAQGAGFPIRSPQEEPTA